MKNLLVLLSVFLATQTFALSKESFKTCQQQLKFMPEVPSSQEDLEGRFYPLYHEKLNYFSEKDIYRFGAKRSRNFSAGPNLITEVGSGVRSIYDGVVQEINYSHMGTKQIQIKQKDGLVLRYMGISEIAVEVGDEVAAGDFLAIVADPRPFRDNKRLVGSAARPNLKIEAYGGYEKGKLTQVGSGCFSRRADLLNPEKFLTKLLN